MTRAALLLVVLAALLAAGCGSEPAREHPRTGPFHASLDSAAAAIRAAGVPVTVDRRPAPVARSSQPHVSDSARLRSGEGTVFDLLVYQSPKEALRAGASIRQALGSGANITFSHNVLMVLHHRRGDSLRIRRAVLALGTDGNAPG